MNTQGAPCSISVFKHTQEAIWRWKRTHWGMSNMDTVRNLTPCSSSARHSSLISTNLDFSYKQQQVDTTPSTHNARTHKHTNIRTHTHLSNFLKLLCKASLCLQILQLLTTQFKLFQNNCYKTWNTNSYIRKCTNCVQ